MAVKFGAMIEMALNSNLTNFGVSSTNSLAPPPVQKFTFHLVITFEPFVLETKFSVSDSSSHTDHN